MMEKTLPTSSIWMLLEIKDRKTVVDVKSRKEMVAPMYSWKGQKGHHKNP